MVTESLFYLISKQSERKFLIMWSFLKNRVKVEKSMDNYSKDYGKIVLRLVFTMTKPTVPALTKVVLYHSCP
jgi:hypothetical protein